MDEPTEIKTNSTPNDVSHDEKSDFQNFYKYYSNLLRTWLVAYGIGGPVILLTNENLWGKVIETGGQTIIGIMFLSGVALQVILAFLNKSLMWNLYFGFVRPGFKKTKRYQISDKLSEKYCIDFSIDGISILLMAAATIMVFAAII